MHKQVVTAVINLKAKKVSQGAQIFQLKSRGKSSDKRRNSNRIISSQNDIVNIQKEI